MNKTSSAICQSQKYWTLLIFIRILEIGALTGFMYIAIIIVRACIFLSTLLYILEEYGRTHSKFLD